MANPDRYLLTTVELGSTAIPVANEVRIANDEDRTAIMSGGRLAPSLYQAIGKMPVLGFDTSNLEAIASIDWTYFAAGQTITEVAAYFQQFQENAGLLAANYESYVLGQGILAPQRLQMSESSPAMLSMLAFGLYSSGTCYTVGTVASVPATVTKQYFPKSVVVGSTTYTEVVDASVTWNWGVDRDGQYEPTYLIYNA